MKTLYFGGTILTMAQPLYAEAVLTENGKILAVGSRQELETEDCRLVDLQGSALLPAFIDPHSHFFQVAVSLLQVSVNGLKTPEAIRERINEFVRTHDVQPGQWVVARDYDNNVMQNLQNPTLAELDSFAPGHPLVMHHKSGHMGLMNSLALEQLNITPSTPVPEGGKIEQKDGKLTGYLEENAFFGYLGQIPMPGLEQLMQAFLDAQTKYASYGIATVQDGMVSKQMLPMYQLLLRKNMLSMDVWLYSGLDTYADTQQLLQQFPDQKYLHSGGLKIFLDGSPQGRTAWMRQPYLDGDGYTGYGTMTDEAVENAFRQAAQANTQLICHCNGDGAAEQFLRCLEKVEQEYPKLKELRPVIIHGQLIGRDQVPRAEKLGAMISFFVAHVYHWGDVHVRNFGMERASRISPARTALDSGVKITFHQDAPVIEPDMLETIWCAVNRISSAGVCLGAEERISTLEALQAVTVNAAYQYGQEQERGSLEPGKVSDFVILSQNPLETPDDQLKNIQVLKTIKADRCLYSRS